jgi:pSer/pThr/pTyr-binding forkhead associated (FHA) protein
MDNIYDSKIVVTSKQGSDDVFYLLNGRTTIGSAPGNDIIIDSQDVSGYHAEFRTDNKFYYITDFSSEKGTFVNEERITQEKRIEAGDTIQLGSTQTVFIPRNAILAKEELFFHKDNYKNGSISSALAHRKWVIVTCALLIVLSVVKLTFNNGNRVEAQQKEPITKNEASGKDGNDKITEHKDTTTISVRNNGTDSPDQIPEGTIGESADTKEIIATNIKPDKTVRICFNIGHKFSDFQLWREALEYYHMVLEEFPDYPELSAQIAKMQFEIRNQLAYQQGQELVNKGNFTEGITRLQKIEENSFYYNKAIQEIVDAKAKTVQPKE